MVVLHEDITVVLVKAYITEKDIIGLKADVTISLGLVNRKEGGVDMAEERKCFLCIYCRKDPGSNWGWYCDYKRTHVRPDDYCGNFSSKY